MGVQIKNELTETQSNIANNLAVQFKRDIDNCNKGKRDYAECKARKKQGAVSTEKRGSNQENKLDEIKE